MARSRRIALAAWVLVALFAPGPMVEAEPTRFQIGPADSSLTFKATSFFMNADGRFGRFKGEVIVDPRDVAATRVRMTVEAASIDTGIRLRDTHLRSGDFFDVERFPAIVFESQRVEGTGASLRVVGRLTIRNVTREVAIPVEVELTADRMVARGEFVLNRQDYGLSYAFLLNPIGDTVRIAFVFRGKPN